MSRPDVRTFPRSAIALLLAASACTRAGAPAAAPAAPPACTPAATAPASAAVARASDRPSDRGSERPPAPARALPAPTTASPGPRATPCLKDPWAAPGALADAAGKALDEGEPARALACAEEALRYAPTLVPALTFRAEALAAAERLDEARLAFSRALAVDPEDPSALLAAGDFHLRKLGTSRDALEAAVAYATHGARAALRPPRADADLAARLELLAGMAENDLGRSHLALPHLDRAIAARPADPDAIYERGVALYELCRFADARKAFEKTLALTPDDAWALHQLGLLAERRGERRAAETLLAKARRLAPDDFPPELAVDDKAFRAEVAAAVAELPLREQKALELAPLELAELPAEDDLVAVEPPLSPTILGLFRGPPEDEACTPGDGPRCRSIVFYRKNLARFARDRPELERQIRITLLHELGHLHGETDDELRDRGLE